MQVACTHAYSIQNSCLQIVIGQIYVGKSDFFHLNQPHRHGDRDVAVWEDEGVICMEAVIGYCSVDSAIYLLT